MAAQTTLTQFRVHGGIPPASLSKVPPDILAQKIEAAESVSYGYISASYAKPFATMPLEFTEAVCKIAAYEVMLYIGYNPEMGDVNFKDRRDGAIAWLRDIGKGIARIAVAEDATPSIDEGGPAVYSSAPRKW